MTGDRSAAQFEKVGMIYRATQPRWHDIPKLDGDPCGDVPATHVLRVVHPSDVSQCWSLDVSVLDDGQARERMRQLAEWVPWGSKVFLYRAADPGKYVCFVWGAKAP